MIGNYNYSDGMYINYDNNYMNPMYGNSMAAGMPGPAPGYMPLQGGCPFMNNQNVNMTQHMRGMCPMMNTGMQYSTVAINPSYVYGGYNQMGMDNYISAMNPGMISMRSVSIQEIQD